MKITNIQCPNCFEKFSHNLDMCPHCGYVEGESAEKSIHMNPGNILQDRYHIGQVLGYGSFGVTYLAWDDVLATKVAIKEYLPSEFSTRTAGETEVIVYSDERRQQYYAGLNKFLDEARRLAKFQSEPGIVGVYDSFKENNTAYIVMEYLEGETLKKFLKREKVMPVDSAIGMLTPVIQSLKVVHREGIIHRDIAPDNIIITKDGEVKLIDFGASRYAAAPKKTIIVKSGYSPLEQYQSKREQGTYTDVFALASVLYYMITGVTPSDAPDRRASIETGKKDSLKAPSVYVKDINPNVENALLNAMNLQIKDRTQDMETFFDELTSEKKVKLRAGSVKKIDSFKWPLWAKIAIPVCALAVVTALVLFFTGIIGPDSGLQNDISITDGMVRVPSVVNNDTETAKDRLEEVNLSYLISGKHYSEIIPSDYVLTQDKSSGTVVMENTVVGVTISKGIETSYVEDVALIDEEEATAILEDAGFDVEIKTEYSKVIAEGSVISQSEEKDTELEVGSTVTLTVSAGAEEGEDAEDGGSEDVDGTENTEVPDFTGMTYDEALTEAENAGVALSVTERTYTDEAEAGTILSQSVDSGEEVPTGTVVELTSSLGEEYVRTPDVQYETEEEAVENLYGLDIYVEYEENENVKEGLVIDQSIKAGEKAELEEEIILTVSTGSPKFEMPNVTDGKNIDEAKKQLGEMGLVVYINYEQNKSKAEGTVLDQSIKSGAEVTAGTEVTLTVSTKDEVVYVADVVGKTVKEAKETLNNQGFDVLFSAENGEGIVDTVDENLIVIAQLPSAESGQKKGSTIVLSVGENKEPGETEGETEETAESEETDEAEESEETEEAEETEESQPEFMAEGTCGENLTWTLDWEGTLTISGTGAMYSYESSLRPWDDYNADIKTIVIEKGVTSIGYAAFVESHVTSVSIPDTVTTIGSYAFNNCRSLTSIEIPDGVTGMGNYTFMDCLELTSVNIPGTVTAIGDSVFFDCISIPELVIPDSVTRIGQTAFFGCTGITSITISGNVASIGAEAFGNWSTDQTINIEGHAKAPSGWDSSWDSDCYAEIVWDESMMDLVYYLGDYDDMMEYLEMVGAESTEGTYDYEVDDGLVGFDLYKTVVGGTGFYISNDGSDAVSIFGIQPGDNEDEIIEKIATYGVYDNSWNDYTIYIVTSDGVEVVFYPHYDDNGGLISWLARSDEDGMSIYNFDLLEAENSYDKDELEDWQIAYIQYIKESGHPESYGESTEYYIYSIAYTSGDTIPALLQFTLSVNTNIACTYQNGEVVTTDIYGFPSYYDVNNNTVFFGITSWGAYQLREYYIGEDGSCTYKHDFLIDNYTFGDPEYYVYYLDGEETTEEIYQETLDGETKNVISLTEYQYNRGELVDAICSYYEAE